MISGYTLPIVEYDQSEYHFSPICHFFVKTLPLSHYHYQGCHISRYQWLSV